MPGNNQIEVVWVTLEAVSLSNTFYTCGRGFSTARPFLKYPWPFRVGGSRNLGSGFVNDHLSYAKSGVCTSNTSSEVLMALNKYWAWELIGSLVENRNRTTVPSILDLGSEVLNTLLMLDVNNHHSVEGFSKIVRLLFAASGSDESLARVWGCHIVSYGSLALDQCWRLSAAARWKLNNLTMMKIAVVPCWFPCWLVES